MLQKTLITALFFVFVATQVSASPVVVTAEGLNHTQSLEMVASVPQKYLVHVDWVEFVSGTLDFRGGPAHGTVYAYWDADHVCYDVKVTVVVRSVPEAHFTLWHELGHAYEYCELRQDTSSEEFADNFVYLKP